MGALHVNMNRVLTARKFSCENNGVRGFLKFTEHVHDRWKRIEGIKMNSRKPYCDEFVLLIHCKKFLVHRNVISQTVLEKTGLKLKTRIVPTQRNCLKMHSKRVSSIPFNLIFSQKYD